MLRALGHVGRGARVFTSRLPSTRPPAHASSGRVSVTPTRAYSRMYPDAPRVGVGVVVLRHNPSTRVPEILLIKRGTEPDIGKWCVPGGGLELGETVAECAAREVFEETGVKIRTENPTGLGQLELPLLLPTPFTAVDCITHDAEGRIQFHYTIVEVAATPVDPHAAVAAMDDVDDILWVAVGELRRLSPLVPQTTQLAEEAVQRFISQCV